MNGYSEKTLFRQPDYTIRNLIRQKEFLRCFLDIFTVYSRYMEHGNFGKKTLFFFMAQRSGFALVCIFIFSMILFFTDILPAFLLPYAQLINFSLVIFILGAIGITISIGFLEYKNFTISIFDRNIKMTRGIFNRYEVGIPYKAIERVDIHRSLVAQLFGVSDIIVYVSHDENPETQDEKVYLSFIEKNLANQIQQEILRRSQVEHITDVDMQQGKI